MVHLGYIFLKFHNSKYIFEIFRTWRKACKDKRKMSTENERASMQSENKRERKRERKIKRQRERERERMKWRKLNSVGFIL